MSRIAALQKKSRYAATTRDWAAPRVDSAVGWAAPKVGQARDWVAPKVEPAVDKVRSDVLPTVVAAVGTALAATEPARSEAASRGSAALAALKGELAPPKKTHKIRTVLLLLSAAGAAVAGWRTWVARQADPVDAWTTPSPRPTPTITPVPVVPATPAETVTGDEPVTDDMASAEVDPAGEVKDPEAAPEK